VLEIHRHSLAVLALKGAARGDLGGGWVVFGARRESKALTPCKIERLGRGKEGPERVGEWGGEKREEIERESKRACKRGAHGV
jgi:hypothetical protein